MWWMMVLWVACSTQPPDTAPDADIDPGADFGTDSDVGLGTDADAGTEAGTEAPVDTTGLSVDGETVEMDDTWRTCAEPDDCVEVETHCGSCCVPAAVSVARAAGFDAARRAVCSPYTGAECDCDPPVGTVDCVDDLCTWVPTD